MNLQELKDCGGIVSTDPIPKEVAWVKKGARGKPVAKKFTVYVVRQAFGDVERLITSSTDRCKAAMFISTSIRLGEGGKESLSYEDAYRLDPGLASALVKAIGEVNQDNSKNV